MTIRVAPTRHRSLIVGHDGSAGADRALDIALTLAAGMQVETTVVRAVKAKESQPRNRLVHDTRSIVQRHPGLECAFVAEVGHPAELLCGCATAADILVVGSRGIGGFAGSLLGSVSNQCLHRASGPILVVPTGRHRLIVESEVERAPMPWDQPVTRVSEGSIVVGHDGSRHSDDALDEALSIAGLLDAPVVVIRAWTIDTAPAGSLWQDGYAIALNEISEIVRARLEDQTEILRQQYPQVRSSCLGVFGSADEVLRRSAADALMLVVGARGHGGFAGLVMGSVTTQSVLRAPCPVLVVPSRGTVGSDDIDTELADDLGVELNVVRH